MTDKFSCMVMRINMDCSGCVRKVRRALLSMHELETHAIEKQQCMVSVRGKFMPQDVATKLRKKTNRRVEILDIQEFNPNWNLSAETVVLDHQFGESHVQPQPNWISPSILRTT